jgi:hypothetical protein
MNVREPDDFLHNPDPKRDRHYDAGGHIFTARGIANLGCLFILATGLLMLLCVLSLSIDLTMIDIPLSAGYPIYSHFTTKHQSREGAFNYGGTNASGQVPALPHNLALIDADTPQSAYTKASHNDPTQQWDLVFSDEFNLDGRTFYPGDDPYWEAVDLNYWQTVSALVHASHPADTPARVTWNGTIRSRPTQRTGTFGSRSILRILSITTTCPTFRAWCAPTISLSDHY